MFTSIATSVLTAGLACIVTTLITQIVIYFKESGKKAKMRKQQELRDVIKETLREEMAPIKQEVAEVRSEFAEVKEGNNLIKSGLQSLIKTDLEDAYDGWIRKGYAPIHIKNELEKLYWVYHNLGKNGVMDSLRDTFNKLPNEKKD